MTFTRGALDISPKVAAATLGSTLAGFVWFLLSKFVDAIMLWSADDITTATGFTAVILTFVLGYFVKDSVSPVTPDVPAEPEPTNPPVNPEG